MKKIKMFLTFVLICHLLLDFTINTKPKKAIVIVPVADLVGQEMQKLTGPQQMQQAYEQLPFSPDIAPGTTCLRIQQLLFNEVVEIIKEKEQEVYIRIPHLFCLIPMSNEPQANYWTLKKNIIRLDKVQQYTGDLTKIPPPISFKNNSEQFSNKNIVTLTEPWFDSKTRLTFSAGTRFVCAVKKKRKTNVYIFNPQTTKYEVTTIPNNKLATHVQQQSPQQQRKRFINLVRQWAKRNEGFIPYVWGGFSFTGTKKTTCLALKDEKTSPKTGLDCSGLIASAAQICGIPYFCKNSTTIKQCLTPLARNSKLMPGDIIWVPGHVMIVADLENHTLIEARGYGYGSGYGKVHEIPLNEEFKGINTYHDLIDAYHNKKIIIWLDRNGNERERVTDLALLRLIDD